MVGCQTTAKAGFLFQAVRIAIILAVLTLVSGLFSLSLATEAKNRRNTVEEEIWKIEEAYFSNLYKANYGGILTLVHPQFLGWPANLPKPIGREESAEFMKKLIPQPTPCIIRIERAGLQHSGDTVLTQYVLYVDCPAASGIMRTQSYSVLVRKLKKVKLNDPTNQ